MEKREILSYRNFLREISSLVTSLVKTLLSRNFYQKSVRANFHEFQTAYFMFCVFTYSKLLIISRISVI